MFVWIDRKFQSKRGTVFSLDARTIAPLTDSVSGWQNARAVSFRWADTWSDSEGTIMQALAKYIAYKLKKEDHCAVYDVELDRVWPRNGIRRQKKIEEFAKDNGWRIGTIRTDSSQSSLKPLTPSPTKLPKPEPTSTNRSAAT